MRCRAILVIACRSIPVAAIALGLSLLVADAGNAADIKLVETVWATNSPDCAIRKIKFLDFGQAIVYADRIGSDDAIWALDSPVLHVYVDDWNANLDGQILGGNDFEATYSWREEESLKQHLVQCTYRPQ